MAQAISHPFRVNPGGSIATVVEGSDDQNGELILAIAMTRRGERELIPEFGTSEPVFNRYDVAEIAACVALFGPDITDLAIDPVFTDSATMSVAIRFE